MWLLAESHAQQDPTFNTPMMLELRGIDFVNRMLASKQLEGAAGYRQINIHAIDAENQMRQFGASSKSNSDWEFLKKLHQIGRQAADKWLSENLDAIGARSSVDIRKKYL